VTLTSAARSDVWALEDAESGSPRFAAFYRQHFSFAWSCLRRLGVPASAIDDAAQELWVTAHRRLRELGWPNDFREPRAAKSWLFAIARRVASHHRRSEHRHRRKLEAISWSRATRQEDSPRESAMIVEAILDQLDPRVREAFVLSEIEGWTAPEIAKATGANTNTVYWRVRVARQELQTQLAAANDGVDAAVIQLRDATRTPKGAAKACWLALGPALAQTSAIGAALSSFGALKAGLLALVAASVTIGTIEVVDREPAPAIVETSVDEPTTTASVAAPPLVPEPPRAASAPAVVAHSVDVPVQVPHGRERAVTQRPVAPVVHEVTEVELLSAARDAFNAGDYARTRTLLTEHADRFPSGGLVDVRDLLLAKASCSDGDAAGARAIVERLIARAPGSATAKKAADICRDPGGATK
jgi:RNA polymerase sigma-70 factor (ECF subfamily)